VPPPTPPAVSRPLPAPPSRSPSLKLVGSVAMVAVLAVLAFTLFGGGAGTVGDPVAEAATVSSNAPGYRMSFSMQILSSAATPITGVGNGAFDARDHTGSMSLTMNLGNDPQVIQALGSDTVTLQEIMSGTTVYEKLPAAISNELPTSGKQWVAIDLAKFAGFPGLSSLESNPVSSDPSEMLQYLRATSDSIVIEGHQLLDGLATTHYHAELSLGRVAAALPSAEQAVAQHVLSTLQQVLKVHEIPVDVWIDAHHLVRKIQMTVDAGLPGGQSFEEEMTIDISHYGPQPEPALPPADQVANLTSMIGSIG